MERTPRVVSSGEQGACQYLDRQSAGQRADAGLRRGDTAIRIPLQSLNAAGLRRAQFRAMASPCEVLVDSSHEQPAQAVASAVAACAARIEEKFSRYREDSVVGRINR